MKQFLFWLGKRLLLLIFIMWGITTIIFIINSVVPRNIAVTMQGSTIYPDQIKKFNEKWGLDKPVYVRYFKFYGYLLKGDLGTSIRTERPVSEEIKRLFPATLELANFAIFIALIIGIPLGILSALKRNKLIDQIARIFSLIGVSTPNFWLGLILLLIFYYFLNLGGPGRISSQAMVPAGITGLYLIDSLLTLNWHSFVDSLKYLVLPSFSLGYFGIGVVSRMMRSSVLETLNKDYVKAAKSRGLSMYKVMIRHVLKNSLLPVITIVGLLYCGFLGGVIVIEVVFGWPGLGNFAYVSILKADAPAILGIVLVISLFFSIVSLIVDIIYRFLDPRIKFN